MLQELYTPSPHSSTQQSGTNFIRGTFKLLWFELEMSPKGSYFESLVPSQDVVCGEVREP